MENNNKEKNKQDVMVSNLPLLFSDGNPTSIDNMTAEDLQYFVPFLIKCILGVEPSKWAQFPKFGWWPDDIPWSPIILSKKHQTLNWQEKFRLLVKRCYEYNGCTYLLHFSAKLRQLIGGFKFTDNWDGTTSMYDSASGKLLVTFRNENRNYDRGFRHQNSTQRPMLLPRLNSPKSPIKMNTATPNPLPLEAPSTAKMVEPPVCDIFLCDYCGADFNTLPAIKAHESKCMADKISDAQQQTCGFSDVETNDLDQAKFMWYMGLSSRHVKLPPSNVTPAKVYPSGKKSYTLNDRRFTTIPFSSNLGQSFFKIPKLSSTASEALVTKYERLCVTKTVPSNGPLSRTPSVATSSEAVNSQANSVCSRRVPTQKRKEDWSHSYSFSRYERKERMKTIETGLNKRARHLLRECGKVRLVLQNLKPETIEWWVQPKPQSHLLDPFIQQSIASLPPTCNVSLAPVEVSTPWLGTNQATSSPFLLSRLDAAKSVGGSKKSVTEPRPKSSPGLLPLITNAWSLQTMESVQPKNRNHFHLPDLIPVNRNVQPRSHHPVVINMPSFASSSSVCSSPVSQSCQKSNTMIVNLCSSEDEQENEEDVNPNTPNSLFLLPGTSVTIKVRDKNSGNGASSNHVSKNSRPTERNNNRSQKNSHWMASTSTLATPLALEVLEQNKRYVKPESPPSITLTPVLLADCSLPIVTPLKLGKFPAEKLEQMKQSLLKIQQEEGKSPNASQQEKIVASLKEKAVDTETKDETNHFSFASANRCINKDVSNLLADECKELRHKGLEGLLVSNQRVTRRKRTGDMNCDDEIKSGLGSCKIPNLDRVRSPSATLRQLRSDPEDGDNFSRIIEVDLAGPDGQEDHMDSSTASSHGSLTPDSRSRRKKTEVSRLLEDECKELRNKGLENLKDSRQRITRCRTQSLPLPVTKMKKIN